MERKVTIPAAHVVFMVRECSDNAREFNGKMYYSVRLENASGYGFNSAIDHHAKIGSLLLYKISHYKGVPKLQYVSDYEESSED